MAETNMKDLQARYRELEQRQIQLVTNISKHTQQVMTESKGKLAVGQKVRADVIQAIKYIETMEKDDNLFRRLEANVEALNAQFEQQAKRSAAGLRTADDTQKIKKTLAEIKNTEAMFKPILNSLLKEKEIELKQLNNELNFFNKELKTIILIEEELAPLIDVKRSQLITARQIENIIKPLQELYKEVSEDKRKDLVEKKIESRALSMIDSIKKFEIRMYQKIEELKALLKKQEDDIKRAAPPT